MHLNRHRFVSRPYAAHIFITISLIITSLFGFSGIVYGLSKPINEKMGYVNMSGCVDPTRAHCSDPLFYSDPSCYGYYGCFFISLYFNLAFYLMAAIGLIVYFRYQEPMSQPLTESYNSSGELR